MKKKLLSVAVGTALGASAVSMNAQADALLFPVFIEQGGAAFTFLALRTDQTVDPDDWFIHYTWSFTDDESKCIHADGRGEMTRFDLTQATVVRPDIGAGLDLPAAFGDQSTVNYLNVGNVTGFIVVQDNSPEGAFGGQAIIIDNATGTVSAYKGFNDPTNTDDANPLNQQPDVADFDSIFVSHISHDFTWYPTDIVNTSWFVLVTGTDMTVGTGWEGAVELDLGFDGVFDRDENFRSGDKGFEIVCNELVTLPNLLNNDQLEHVRLGGWTWVTQTLLENGGGDPQPPGDSTGTLAFKIETTTALGPVKSAVSAENAFPNFPY